MPKSIPELHNIMPIKNIPNVLKHGILCHNKVKVLNPESIADSTIQTIRKNKSIPGGMALHNYANLYFNGRNPMLYKRKSQNDLICILRISKDVLKLPNVIITDQNAASRYVRFYSVSEGLKALNYDWIYAKDWTHPEDQIAYFQHKSCMCAEALIPEFVPVEYIIGAYVNNLKAQENIKNLGFIKPVTISHYMFFED